VRGEDIADESAAVNVAVVVPLFPSMIMTSLNVRFGMASSKPPTFSRRPVAVIPPSDAVAIPRASTAARTCGAVAAG
jgi:hypothetical protein